MKILMVPCVYVTATDLLRVMCTFLLFLRKENIRELSLEEVQRKAVDFNGQRLEGLIPGNEC